VHAGAGDMTLVAHRDFVGGFDDERVALLLPHGDGLGLLLHLILPFATTLAVVWTGVQHRDVPASV